MKIKLWWIGCFSVLLILGGCSLSEDYPCSCIPPKKQQQEQQDKTLDLRGIVWSQGKVQL